MLISKDKFAVAYFSMEIALENDLKTYAGGLGILAGDLLKSAAQMNFPIVGLSLINRQGYFKQVLTKDGKQIAEPDFDYDFSKLKKLPDSVIVNIGEERVKVGVWQYLISGINNFSAPVYFLDTDFPENSNELRFLTSDLYGGDKEHRLKQEIILGRAGVKMLKQLGYEKIKKFHLNEGHGALAAVELFLNSQKKNNSEKVKEVRQQIVFTTHTPLKKQQDVFSQQELKRYQTDFPDHLPGLIGREGINLTVVGLYFSGYTNAVSELHQKVTEKMFPGYKIHAITNGVNSVAWTAEEFKKLYDKYVSNWRQYAPLLLNAEKISLNEIWNAHQIEKKHLIKYLNDKSKIKFSEDVFTIAFARRFTPYKRPDFLFNDIKRLLEAQKNSGQIQLIYAGKAHPNDLNGQMLIRKIFEFKKQLSSKIKIIFLENYDMKLSKLLVSGVDLWLNTPLIPNEASGTSGMKAAHNGIPQLSTLDGWWPEGYHKNKTGWAIIEKKIRKLKKKKNSNKNIDRGKDYWENFSEEKIIEKKEAQKNISNLYDLLEQEILPTYYHNKQKWQKIMRSTISLNASYFNTDRAMSQYIKEAYRLK